MRSLSSLSVALLQLLLCAPSVLCASEPTSTPTPHSPCTAHSALTGTSFDLSALTLSSTGKHSTNVSHHARGWDYPSNFTLNICGPVVEAPSFSYVDGLRKPEFANISAYYTEVDSRGDETVYSIGNMNTELTVRGRKVLLNYTGGSPCPELDEDGNPIYMHKREIIGGGGKNKGGNDDDDDDDDDNDGDLPPKKGTGNKGTKAQRRKNTMLSFICDTSPLLSAAPRISFLGTPDQCTYVFEIRSRHGCGGAAIAEQQKGTIGPAGVFGLIVGIGFAAYLIGGIVYQRNVLNQRGWRQLPNYGVWSGIWGFISDMFQILLGPCIRRLPGTDRLFGSARGGYHRVGGNRQPGRGILGESGRGRSNDEDNRLIDDLNEEWDD